MSPSTGTSVTNDVRARLRARLFVMSWLTRVAIALAIVFLMTNKPDLVGGAAGALTTRGSAGDTGAITQPGGAGKSMRSRWQPWW